MRLGIEFGLEIGLVRRAHAGSVRATALRHEPLKHPMEFRSVVKAFGNQFLDPRNMAGGKVRPQLDNNVSAAVSGVERKGELFV